MLLEADLKCLTTNMSAQGLLSFMGKIAVLTVRKDCFHTNQVSFCFAGAHSVSPSNPMIASKKSGY